MRQPLLSSRGQQAAGQLSLVSRPAPVRGWNTRDPVARLNPLYAQLLDNLYPTEGAVQLRGGSASFATGATGTVKTLISFQTNAGTGSKLLAVSDAGIYDATAGGAMGALKKALTEGNLETVNITNSAGTNYIWGCNGVDKIVVSSDGTTWTSLDGASTPAITGITTTDANWCWMFKRRIFVILKNSMKCAYGPIDSIAGAFATMNLGAIFKRGGYLLSGANWTVDAGTGADDLCVFITSEGEIAVYKGINPASAASWELIGVYYAGRPATRRCFVNYGGDLVVNTEMGLIPLARLLSGKLLQPSESLTDAIRPTFASVHRNYRTLAGWQTLVYPSQNALITNVPTAATTSMQLVMNAVTGAWCSFSSWDAACFVVHGGVLYFGNSDGEVWKAWDGVLTADGSADVLGTVLFANERFGGTRQSQVGMVRPLISTDGSVEINLGFVSDFDEPEITSTIPRNTTATGGIWDTGLWDSAIWGGGTILLRSWYNVSCDPGTYIAPYLQLASNDATLVQLSGQDYQVKSAGWM